MTQQIADIRGIPVGQDSISPNRHKDIGNVRELGAFVNRVRTITGKPVGVKFVAGDPTFLDDWFTECTVRPEGCPDYIQVDGGEGGSGAAPASLMDYVGMPITLALPQVALARETAWVEGPHPHHRLRQTRSPPTKSRGLCAWAPISFPRPAASCFHWAASRR